jgi:hypothetical protein
VSKQRTLQHSQQPAASSQQLLIRPAASSQQLLIYITHSLEHPSSIPPMAASHARAPAPSSLPCSVSKPESFKLLYHVLEIIPAYRWEERQRCLLPAAAC